MRKLFAFLSVLILALTLPVGAAWGTLYCVKPNGEVTAANKANAVVTSAAECTGARAAGNNNGGALSMANANSVTGLSDGDTVYFSARNLDGSTVADYATAFVAPVGGAAAQIIYQGIADGTADAYPKIINNSTYQIGTNSKNYIKVDGFQLEYTGTSTSTYSISISAGNYITLSNLSMDRNGYGLAIIDLGATHNYLTIEDINVTGMVASTATNAMRFYNCTDGACTNLTLRNILIDGAGAGVDILTWDNITIENFDIVWNSANTTSGFELGSSTAGKEVTNATITGFIARSNDPKTSMACSDEPKTYSTTYGRFEINGASSNITVSNSSFTDTHNVVVGDTTSNVTFTNISILRGVSQGVSFAAGTNNVTLQNSEISLVTGDAVVAFGSNETIKNNKIYCNGSKTIAGAGDGIAFETAAATGNKAIGNLIYCNIESGVIATAGSQFEAYNNTIYANGGNWSSGGNSYCGMPQATSGGKNTVRGGLVIFNTVVAPDTHSVVSKNNILSKNYPVEISISQPYTETGQFVTVHNVFNPISDNAVAFWNTLKRSWTYWTETLSRDANSVNADPLFNSVPTDFTLQSGSPAIDAGTPIPGLHTGSTIVGGDAAGNTGLYGSGVDIGAYEYQQSEATKPSIPDGAVNVALNPTLSVTVTHPENAVMDICFYGGRTGEPMQLIACVTGVGSGAVASIAWNSLQGSTAYMWQVEMDDGLLSTPSPIWVFTTQEVLSVPALNRTTALIAIVALFIMGTVIVQRR